MICFEAKTDQEVKEKVTCGSHLKKKTNIKREKEVCRERERNIFLFFSSLTSLFDIQKSDRQNSSGQEAKCSTR